MFAVVEPLPLRRLNVGESKGSTCSTAVLFLAGRFGAVARRIPAGRVMTIASDVPDLRDSDAWCVLSDHESLACGQMSCRREVLIDHRTFRCEGREWYRDPADDAHALPTPLRWSCPSPQSDRRMMQNRTSNLRQSSVYACGPPIEAPGTVPSNTGLDPVAGVPAINEVPHLDMLPCIHSDAIWIEPISRKVARQNSTVDSGGTDARVGDDPIRKLRIDLPHAISGTMDEPLVRCEAVAGTAEEANRNSDLGQWHLTRIDAAPTAAVPSESYGDNRVVLVLQANDTTGHDSISIETDVSSGHPVVADSQNVARSIESWCFDSDAGWVVTGTLDVNRVVPEMSSSMMHVGLGTQLSAEQTVTLVQGTTVTSIDVVGADSVRCVIGNLVLRNELVDKKRDRSPARSVSAFLVAQPIATDMDLSRLNIGSWVEISDRVGFVDFHRLLLVGAATGQVSQQGVFRISLMNGGAQGATNSGSGETIVLGARNPRCLTRVANSRYLVNASRWHQELGLTNATIATNDGRSVSHATCVSLSGTASADVDPVMVGIHPRNTGETTYLACAAVTRPWSHVNESQPIHWRWHVERPVSVVDAMHHWPRGQLVIDHARPLCDSMTPVITTQIPRSNAVFEAVSFELCNQSSTSWTYGDHCSAENQTATFRTTEVEDDQRVEMDADGHQVGSRRRQVQDVPGSQRLLLVQEGGQSLTHVDWTNEGTVEFSAACVASCMSCDAMAEHLFASSAACYDYAMRSLETNATMQAATRFFFRQRCRPQQSQELIDDAGTCFPADLVTTAVMDCGQACHAIVPVMPMPASRTPKTISLNVLARRPEDTSLRNLHHSAVVMPEHPSVTCTVTMVPQFCNRASWCRLIHSSVRSMSGGWLVSENYFPPLRAFQLPRLILADHSSRKIDTVGSSQASVGIQNVALRPSATDPSDFSSPTQGTKDVRGQSHGTGKQDGVLKTCITNRVFQQLRSLRSPRRYTNPRSGHLQANWSLIEVLATPRENNLGLDPGSTHFLVVTDKRSVVYLSGGKHNSLMNDFLVTTHLQLCQDQAPATDPLVAISGVAHVVSVNTGVAAAQGMGMIDCLAATADTAAYEARKGCPGVAIEARGQPSPSEKTETRANIARFQQSMDMSEVCRYQTCSGIAVPRAA